jgi:hypothetical protein
MSTIADKLPFFAFSTGSETPSKHVNKTPETFFIDSTDTKPQFSANKIKIKKMVSCNL